MPLDVYKRQESNSVGYKSDYEMYSMDFEEFLWAKGYDEGFVEDMLPVSYTHLCSRTASSTKTFVR